MRGLLLFELRISTNAEALLSKQAETWLLYEPTGGFAAAAASSTRSYTTERSSSSAGPAGSPAAAGPDFGRWRQGAGLGQAENEAALCSW